MKYSRSPSDVERRHRLRRAEDGPAERMLRPELLREHLVDEIVGRVLDHLDLFEDDALLASSMSAGANAGRMSMSLSRSIASRQVLVEHLDVVARVLLGGERVELAADRVDRLRDHLRRPRRRALEEHVLDEVRDAAFGVGLVPRSARQPHADRHRPHVRHRFGHEPQARRQRFGNYHASQRSKLFTGLTLSAVAKTTMIAWGRASVKTSGVVSAPTGRKRHPRSLSMNNADEPR